jgi:hypothetical protein
MQVIHGSHPRSWSDRYFEERAFGGEIFRPGSAPAVQVNRPAWLERFERGPEAKAYVVEPNCQVAIQGWVQASRPRPETIAPAFELPEPPPRCRACGVVIDSWGAYEAHKEHVQ